MIDYKTSERARTPEQAHRDRRSGAWRDLQLPLYELFLRREGVEGRLDLCFLNLDPSHVGSPLAIADWSRADLEAARREAEERGSARPPRGVLAPLGPTALR